MTEYCFFRDLPDGSRHMLDMSEAIERPKERYFDDFLRLSRTDEQEGKLLVTHFGREQSYPDRTIRRVTDSYILHYITEGYGTYNGKKLGRGEGFLLWPNVGHTMIADHDMPWHFKWIVLKGREIPYLLRSIGLSEKSDIFSYSFTGVVEEIADAVLYRTHEVDISTYLEGMLYLLLAFHRGENRNISGTSLGVNRYVDLAIRYLDLHFHEDIRISDVARELHISRKYLSAKFRESLGLSPKDYLLAKRIDEASALLLQRELSVSEIARRVGYTNYTELSRLFRAKKGMSPMEYRKLDACRTDVVSFLPLEKE